MVKNVINLILIIILLFILFVVGVFVYINYIKVPTGALPPPEESCELLYEEIENDFEKANYCEQDLDCKVIALGIEFDCWKYVNKEVDENEFLRRVQEYDRRCNKAINNCMLAPDATCISSKCVYIELEFPIDSEAEAIAYAKTDLDVKEFMGGILRDGFKIGSWAYFDKEQNFWVVGIYPDSTDILDIWYEIHFLPDGEILQKGRGLGA